jgi:hypothetical protein
VQIVAHAARQGQPQLEWREAPLTPLGNAAEADDVTPSRIRESRRPHDVLEDSTMQPRIDYPAQTAPGTLQALLKLGNATQQAGLPLRRTNTRAHGEPPSVTEDRTARRDEPASDHLLVVARFRPE